MSWLIHQSQTSHCTEFFSWQFFNPIDQSINDHLANFCHRLIHIFFTDFGRISPKFRIQWPNTVVSSLRRTTWESVDINENLHPMGSHLPQKLFEPRTRDCDQRCIFSVEWIWHNDSVMFWIMLA